MSERSTGGRLGGIGLGLGMLAGVLAWLWPIGPGGRMPVGGDATQFSMGLMAFLRESIRAGRLPLWNDLWGFGFPGVAESQMGVFYPPHLLLYGTLPTERAYTLSLVLHILWGALGARWAARRFGASPGASALSGFAFATSGFALIHLPHQWAYTVGSWMPWAWGLAWQSARGEGTRRTPWLLSAVLAVQVLPGHFQLAFITEVSILALALASGRPIRGTLVVGLALAGMAPMAAMQLWPTYRLASLSGSSRGFEYLSGFAATPIHLVSYVAPGLFHRWPLWRPVAWDPFHTSPEEHLAYVGLAPLFLALAASRRGWRADPAVRALTLAAGVTLWLSLGPYVPGFSALIHLPGFSFFRAPARWGLATSLALSILAGLGLDALRAWPRPGRSAARFALGAVAATALVVGGFELALAGSQGAGWPSVASGYDRALSVLPWAGEPRERPFAEVMASARRPQDDLRAQSALARLEGRPAPPPGPTLAATRFVAYRRELGDSAVLVAGLLSASALGRRPRAFAAALVALAGADALLMARHRPFDLGPVRPLVEQSPTLARLAAGPRGTRTLDPAQNLFLVAGAAPVAAYRTLDLPSPAGLIRLASHAGAYPRGAEALRAAGVGVRVLGPAETRGFSARSIEEWAPGAEAVSDPTLAGWLYGADLANASGLRDFQLSRTRGEASEAWLVASGDLRADDMSDPARILDAFRSASPLPPRSDAPERAEVEVKVVAPGPSTVVLSRTFDPGWRASWSGPSGGRPAEVVRVLGGWQGVATPGPGRWTLRLEYPGRDVWLGLTLSSCAWSVWFIGWVRPGTSGVAGGGAS